MHSLVSPIELHRVLAKGPLSRLTGDLMVWNVPGHEQAACLGVGMVVKHIQHHQASLNRERGAPCQDSMQLYRTAGWLVHVLPVFSLFPVCSVNLMCCDLFPHFLLPSCMHLGFTCMWLSLFIYLRLHYIATKSFPCFTYIPVHVQKFYIVCHDQYMVKQVTCTFCT